MPRETPRQLVFALPGKKALGREDFFVAPSNRGAVATLENWRNWPQGKLCLIGPAGSGKTHLVQVWSAETGAHVYPAGNLPDDPTRIESRFVAIEDVDRGPAQMQNTLFHLHNHVLNFNGRLLLTATLPPSRWSLTLADLESRMQATQLARLAPPDDTLLAAVLLKLFQDRQINPPPALIEWLLKRMPRSFAAARRIVAEIDSRALAEKRPIGQGLAREALSSVARCDENTGIPSPKPSGPAA